VSGQNDANQPILPPGRYELLVTEHVARSASELGSRAQWRPLQRDEAPAHLARHLRKVLSSVLQSNAFEPHTQRQIEVCNRLIRELESLVAQDGQPSSETVARSEILLSVVGDERAGLGTPPPPDAPLTPLSNDSFFANSPNDPRLAGELRREIASADRIDLLCAFITWNGMRVFKDELRRAWERGVSLRVITTTYTGITEPRALDELVQLGAQVKVSYDTRATRLHAKAWLFRRNSGFGTAYLGSSNVTHAALHEGLEWNVRLTQASSPDLMDRFRVTFESYWDDDRFEPYDAAVFAQAVSRERGRQIGRDIDLSSLAEFEIRPFPYQETILGQLDVERTRHGHWSNLVVAATGTGKTVIAAFDYQRLLETRGDLKLLFVAHRQEILEQSRSIFQAVLRDRGFGELFVAGERPIRGEHVFASVQSLAHVDLTQIDPSYYDMLVVDEFHHAAAPTYRRLLEYFKPVVLLGMTATPERADVIDVTHWFAGRIAAELRLWDALEQCLLCPFQYFGLADVVDLESVEWRRGGYDVGQLSRLYTGHNIRANRILEQVRQFVLDPLHMRALGFCVSVEHAHFMAERFNAAGIPAAALSGDSPSAERENTLGRFRRGELNAVFSVDLLNEGLDIPEVDTVLLLRPTESVTVFLQQIGRGLRLAPGKQGLTILDFIGQQRREFRFGPRFEVLTRSVRSEVLRHVEEDFPRLPAGCSIWLEAKAREVVLRNIRESLKVGRAGLARELASLGDMSLAEFLLRTDHTLDEVYAGGSGGWTALRRDAGFQVVAGPDQDRLGRALQRMRHIEDATRVNSYIDALRNEQPPLVAQLSLGDQRSLTMLHFDLWGRTKEFADLDASLKRLWQHPDIRDELAQLLEVLGNRSEQAEYDPGLDAANPLRVHQRYTRLEVLAAMGVGSPAQPPAVREGVYYVQGVADLFFVTLQKDPARFKPTTRYHDYALSSHLFHWESQSTTSDSSPTGQRYIHHRELGTRVLLFVRESTHGAAGESIPFLFLGPAECRDHTGSRPMAITWHLEYSMPADFLQEARAVA
jgi:superfamily II DNA or RNA helicase/HKD family nuclease